VMVRVVVDRERSPKPLTRTLIVRDRAPVGILTLADPTTAVLPTHMPQRGRPVNESLIPRPQRPPEGRRGPRVPIDMMSVEAGAGAPGPGINSRRRSAVMIGDSERMNDSRLTRRASLRTGRDRVAQVLLLEPWGLFSRLISWF
jgi:hypothetical protein